MRKLLLTTLLAILTLVTGAQESQLETGKETDSTMYKEGFPNDHNDTSDLRDE